MKKNRDAEMLSRKQHYEKNNYAEKTALRKKQREIKVLPQAVL